MQLPSAVSLSSHCVIVSWLQPPPETPCRGGRGEHACMHPTSSMRLQTSLNLECTPNDYPQQCSRDADFPALDASEGKRALGSLRELLVEW